MALTPTAAVGRSDVGIGVELLAREGKPAVGTAFFWRAAQRSQHWDRGCIEHLRSFWRWRSLPEVISPLLVGRAGSIEFSGCRRELLASTSPYNCTSGSQPQNPISNIQNGITRHPQRMDRRARHFLARWDRCAQLERVRVRWH